MERLVLEILGLIEGVANGLGNSILEIADAVHRLAESETQRASKMRELESRLRSLEQRGPH